MQLTIAKNIGFCSGVKRAIKITEQLIKKEKKNIFCLGPIIHNELVQEQLKNKGINTIYSLEEIDGKVWLILPSHGTTLAILKEAKRKRLNIVDTTCPNVKNLQNICKRLDKEKYQIVILGDCNHPEIRSILSIVPKAKVIKDKSELKDSVLGSHIGVVSQTTQSFDKFRSMIEYLIKHHDWIKELRIFNTICRDVILRQKEVKHLATTNDAVFVIGSSSSANTRRLLSISRYINPHSYLIKKPCDVEKKLKPEFKKIGIISGASAPNWLVKKIIGTILKN